MKGDDSSLLPEELEEVRRTADALLREADAYGHFPTPVADILCTAKLVVGETLSLELHSRTIFESLGSSFGKRARPLVSGLKKVLGLLHIPSGEIFLDQSLHPKQQIWVKLHETGHGCLPHQKRMYKVVEDGEFELNPETQELFEREANNFAAETLYQLDTYEKVAADYVVSIKTPMQLSTMFGGSIYSSMRRYVTTHFSPVGLAVYDQPAAGSNNVVFQLRRQPMASASFLKKYGVYSWPNPCTWNNWLWPMLRKRRLAEEMTTITDINGDLHECEIQLFNSTYQIFVLMIPGAKLSNVYGLSAARRKKYSA